MSIELVMLSNHLILCRSPLLPSVFPSIKVFSNESALCIRWPKYWSFSFSISPSNEYSGLISFGIDWCDLLAVQGTLKSLLQHHSSKESILQHSAFVMVQLSHSYMTTGKTTALTIWTFVGKVESLIWQSDVILFRLSQRQIKPNSQLLPFYPLSSWFPSSGNSTIIHPVSQASCLKCIQGSLSFSSNVTSKYWWTPRQSSPHSYHLPITTA